MNRPLVPGLVIAAPSSGQGKTLMTLALLRVLQGRGMAVAPIKLGPDYIDAAFHTLAAKKPCYNLDPWAMRSETLDNVVAWTVSGNDLILAEAATGLFDGARDGTGSGAEVAVRFGWPILLVMDAKGQGATAAALVQGLTRFWPDVRIAGILFNHVGSAGHETLLRQAMAVHMPEIPVLGCFPRKSDLTLPSRHLGLIQAAETTELEEILHRAVGWLEDHGDVDRIMSLAGGGVCPTNQPPMPLPPFGQHIAIAQDAAFSFVYEAMLTGWRQAGAELSFFSPLMNEGPSPKANAVYLPGGYPELHAGRLARAGGFLAGLREAAARDVFIYGECGGYMVLGEEVIDVGGQSHRMAGLLPLETSFDPKKRHLGYRRITALCDTPLGAKGTAFRGHEFHYSTTTRTGPAPALFHAHDACGENGMGTGLCVGSVCGSFLHLIDQA